MIAESIQWRNRAAADREAAAREPTQNARNRLLYSAEMHEQIAAHAEEAEAARARIQAAKERKAA
jgi:hypothetical protein